MTAEKFKRKLAAILSADVKGYSRLMGEDEGWALRTLNAYKGVMGSLVQQYRGRVVGTAYWLRLPVRNISSVFL